MWQHFRSGHASRMNFKQSGEEKLKEKSPIKNEQQKSCQDKNSSYKCNLTNKISSFLFIKNVFNTR